MVYPNVEEAVFLERPNRFVARIRIGKEETEAHVKNTGRCGELLIPEAKIWVSRSDDPKRRTRYDLVTVEKEGGMLVNLDSQAPNAVVKEWLMSQPFDEVKSETVYGSSRIDFSMRRGESRFLLEIKGCTLEQEGIGYFPDAPTARGTKHLRELIRAKEQGIQSMIGFVIQMEGVKHVLANRRTDPVFADTLQEAAQCGIPVLFFLCKVTPDSLVIDCARTKQGKFEFTEDN